MDDIGFETNRCGPSPGFGNRIGVYDRLVNKSKTATDRFFPITFFRAGELEIVNRGVL